MTYSIELDKEAWDRACRLIETLARNIGGIAPGSHTTLYADLNDHGLLAEEIARKDREADKVIALSPIKVTGDMILKAADRAKTKNYKLIEKTLAQTAREYAESGSVLTPEALIEVAANRFIGSREAWIARGRPKGGHV